ncbi:uncharacterized protein [Nicotiana tomentosiformis]|uniref:uncharacterized protein n=1 Tax=Nicotiana tomentosiformis TaxID=4098 RepID=UPI00388C470B
MAKELKKLTWRVQSVEDVELPEGYKLPKFEMFDGTSDPEVHLRTYCDKLVGVGKNEQIRMKLFMRSLTRDAFSWYISQNPKKLANWVSMASDFMDRFRFNTEKVPDAFYIQNLKKKPIETFREYATRWRSEAAKSDTVPWDYVAKARRKGKAKMEETGAAQGMTRTGRVYTPENLGGTSKEGAPKLPVVKTDSHKNALMKVLSEAYVPADITSREMANMVEQVLESHKITFHEDELPPEGLGHNKALHITVQFEDKFIARVLIDGGSSLNICPLTTLKRLGKGLHEIWMESMNVNAFDGSHRATIGEINLDLHMGPTWFNVEFQVLDISTTYNLLLGWPWIHAAGAVASTLHQAVKFEWNH